MRLAAWFQWMEERPPFDRSVLEEGRAMITGYHLHDGPLYPDLKGRVVAITGASRGLGLAMAKGFAQNGAHVLIGSLSLSESEGAADLILKAGGSAVPYQLDVADR